MEELTGRGVYYGAALAEAEACKDQTVVVVGGANSAGQAAVFLAKQAARVVILVRGDGLEASMSHYLIEQIEGDREHRGAHGHAGDRGARGRAPGAARARR